MTEIVIDLDGERDAYAVSDFEDLVHPKELNQLKKMLKYSVGIAEDYTRDRRGQEYSKPMSVRRHDTIMLAGVRGCGKTTFMLSALNYIEKGIDHKDFISGVESMGIIDPTLIERKVHIFVNIIAMVKEIVIRKAKKQNCFSEDNEFSRKYKEWQNSFRRLAEGLPSINGVGADGFINDDWLDSEFVMDKGVQMARASNTLERNFHDYIYYSLNFIDKKAFVLCFDDIDTHFEKGWPVLEIIHKYLTTPQFITILSGDPQLYSILIRQKQWENFSDKLLKMEARSSKERQSFKDTVAHLEEQYFLKILKPERRIFLSSLYQKDKDLDYPIFVKRKDSSKETLGGYYYKLMKEMGIISGSQQQSYYQFLASLPIRTQKQLLHSFDNTPDEIAHSISDIFWSDLSEKNVDVSSLRNAPQHIVPDVLVYLVKNRILNEGYTLAPVFSDQLVNGAQFALGALVTFRIKQEPGLIFDYWIRVALSRELGILWEDRSYGNNKGPAIDDLILHCAMDQGRPARYVARLATSYIRAYRGLVLEGSHLNKSWHGTLPLFALARKSHIEASDKTRIDTVIGEISAKDGLAGLISSFPLSGVTDHKGSTLPVYSFYNLLGILGEIIDAAKNHETELAAKEIFPVLQKNSQFREYPVPNWALLIADSTGDVSAENIEKEQEEVKCTPPKVFLKEITQWAKEGTGIVVSASVLGKSFTRFFYTMNSMDKELSNETRLGEWMHRMVIAFLNSILIVEALENLSSKEFGLSLLNPVKTDKIFIDNLKKFNDQRINTDCRDMCLSKWILSCPIWLFYLKKEISELDRFLVPISKEENKGQNFINTELARTKNRKIWSGKTVYFDLNKVVVKGHGASMTVKERFSVNGKGHLEDVKKIFQKAEKTSESILQENSDAIIDLLKNGLKSKYIVNRINSLTIKSIVTRIKNKSLKW